MLTKWFLQAFPFSEDRELTLLAKNPIFWISTKNLLLQLFAQIYALVVHVHLGTIQHASS